MNFNHFKDLVVTPTLKALEPEIPYSKEAETLLMMTAAHESRAATVLTQFQGPALGVYQIEPPTEKDIFENYLKYRAPIEQKVKSFMSEQENQMVVNLGYATVMARLHYFRDHKAIPKSEDFPNQDDWLRQLGEYAKRVFNTVEGKATPARYVSDYLAWKQNVYY